MNTILVTGGTGFIGSHTAVELLSSNYKVIIVDNLSNSKIEILDGIKKITGKTPTFIKTDCCNQNEINKIFQQNQISAVIHFAAAKAVNESIEKPLFYYNNNINSLTTILTAMKKHKVHNIVFSSSCTVYGNPDKLPVTEKSPRKKANSPYGNTKHICEDIITDTTNAYQNINAISLRYFNPIGAHPSALIGELPQGTPSNLIPYITQTAAKIKKELKIFGNDYNTPDGSCIRDFINVVDLAKSHQIAIERLLNKKNKTKHETFNIGTGKGTSVIHILNSFIKTTGVNVPHKIVGRRPGDIAEIYADTKLANKELGWKAKISLEETLLSAWKWEKNYRANN